jgi:hypothetical protein
MRTRGEIEAAICERVSRFEQEYMGRRVIVRGRSDSHHVRQLALAAVREAFEALEFQRDRIELAIEVCGE